MTVLRGVLLILMMLACHTPYSVTAATATEEALSLRQQRLIKALKGFKKNAFDEWISNIEEHFKYLKTTKLLTAGEAYDTLGRLRSAILSLPQSNFAKPEMRATAHCLEELKTFLTAKVDIARENLGIHSSQFLMTQHAKTIQLQQDIFSIMHPGDQEDNFRSEDEPTLISDRLERVLEFASRKSKTDYYTCEKIIAFNFEQTLSYFKAGMWVAKSGALEFALAFCRLVKFVADFNDKNRQILLYSNDGGLDPITRYFIPEPRSGQNIHDYSITQKLVYAYALLYAGYDRADLINAAFDLQLDLKYPVVQKFAPAFLRLAAEKLLAKNYVLGMSFAEELFTRLSSFIRPFTAYGLDEAALAIEFKIVIQNIDGTISKVGDTLKPVQHPLGGMKTYGKRTWLRVKRLIKAWF